MIHQTKRIFQLLFVRACLPVMFAFVALSPAAAQGLPGQPAERVDFPATSPGVPAYARLELLVPNFDVPNNRRWAAVVFYRSPDCVPAGFNLGDFFDLPGPQGLGAFACPLLIEGHELWTNGRDEDVAPRFVFSRNAVSKLPVWFVAWSELQPVLASGFVGIEDLRNMSSLRRGHARWFEERLYPNGVPGQSGGADAPGISIRASGELEDGRMFSLMWDYADFGETDDVIIGFSPRRPLCGNACDAISADLWPSRPCRACE
jgi:hypothetical protein